MATDLLLGGGIGGVGGSLGARTMPSHADEAARLTSRANEVHQVLDPIAQGRRTTAALGTREGTDILGAGAQRDLSPAQRAALHDGELAAKLPGEHAEVTVMNHANQAGLHPRDIGVSRDLPRLPDRDRELGRPGDRRLQRGMARLTSRCCDMTKPPCWTS